MKKYVLYGCYFSLLCATYGLYIVYNKTQSAIWTVHCDTRLAIDAASVIKNNIILLLKEKNIQDPLCPGFFSCIKAIQESGSLYKKNLYVSALSPIALINDDALLLENGSIVARKNYVEAAFEGLIQCFGNKEVLKKDGGLIGNWLLEQTIVHELAHAFTWHDKNTIILHNEHNKVLIQVSYAQVINPDTCTIISHVLQQKKGKEKDVQGIFVDIRFGNMFICKKGGVVYGKV